jgi:hypothetical protein
MVCASGRAPGVAEGENTMMTCNCPKINVTLHVATLAAALAALKASMKIASEVPDGALPIPAQDSKRARAIMRSAIAELERVKDAHDIAVSEIMEMDASDAPSSWTYRHG